MYVARTTTRGQHHSALGNLVDESLQHVVVVAATDFVVNGFQ
jgi:hypothetical protein